MRSFTQKASRTSIRAFTGAPQEVCRQLGQVNESQIIAVLLDKSNAREVEVVAQVLIQITQLTQESLVTRSLATLSSLVAALLPKEMPSPTLLREAKMVLRAKEAVLASGDWLNAAELASLIELSAKNPNSQLQSWIRKGKIFSIRHDGIDYFPGYALDPHNDYRPHRALKMVIKQFSGDRDGWALAFWFHSANSLLGGKCPKALLTTQSANVVAAAANELIGAVHA